MRKRIEHVQRNTPTAKSELGQRTVFDSPVDLQRLSFRRVEHGLNRSADDSAGSEYRDAAATAFGGNDFFQRPANSCFETRPRFHAVHFQFSA